MALPAVLTIDQRRSRGSPASAEALAGELNRAVPETLLPFELTVGDELQGVLSTPESIAAVIRRVSSDGDWWIGIGLGGVELADSARRSGGPAFIAARTAVERAKKLPWGVAVSEATETDREAARDLERAIALWVTIMRSRTERGWEIMRLRETVQTEAEAARLLGITQQAVNQRLRAAHSHVDEEGRELTVSLARRALEQVP